MPINELIRRVSESKASTPSPVTKSNDAIKVSSPSNAGGANEAAPATPAVSTASDGSPSVLNALEKLIEKSFDPTSKRGTGAVGSNILRRLGIDEGQFHY